MGYYIPICLGIFVTFVYPILYAIYFNKFVAPKKYPKYYEKIKNESFLKQVFGHPMF